MAYFTYVSEPRNLTEAESAQVDGYVSAQMTAGTTNGDRYVWTINSDPEVEPVQKQKVRMWGTIESATGFKTLFAGFSPAITVALY